ncbi:polysaccharide deacetylase family protein [Fulvivirga sp. RKSG066]|uniref:polysaccharide deacetylase family protein n=1 Tax=Fulvivirga aurantia TaxID=2529383 RepID=UPI0012BBA113|nr:polysaccharide deacetylase family protein [Fulvivirga aurantia]MTI20461.1 polysaccharide deacetylase family protein [Fulvivirga aurantia]
MFFHKTPAPARWLFPSLLWKKKTNNKEIYLTFDDGPIPGLTEYILDVLKDYNVKATFFCVGENIKKNKSIAERALREGHRLGNHSYNHCNGWQTSTIDYISNVVRCQRHLLDLHDHDVKPLFRPPYGKMKLSQIKLLKKKYQIVMWDVLSGDFLNDMEPEVCLKKSIKATGKGSIVIFHDNIKAEENVKYSLSRYIKHFLDKGYSFKTL